MRTGTTCKVLLAAWLVVTAARGQSEARASADALFRAARDDFDRGAYAEACRKFEESNRLDPAPGTLLNLSLCYEKIGKLASAWEGYRQVAEKLRDERVGFATQRSAALEERLPWLTVRLSPGAPAGTRVLRDGVELRGPSLGTALPVDPGTHVIVVRVEGHAESKTTVELEEATRRELTVAVGPRNAEAPTPRRDFGHDDQPAPEPAAPPDRTLAWGLGAVGLAGVGTSLIAGTSAVSDRATVREHCVDMRCDAEGLEAAASGRTMATVSTVSGVLGVGSLAVSAYLLFWRNTQEAPATSVDVAVIPGGGALGWKGRF